MSRLVALDTSGSKITCETILAVIFLELSLRSVQDGKLENCWEPYIWVELHEKFLSKKSALSLDVFKTSGPLKRGGMVDPC